MDAVARAKALAGRFETRAAGYDASARFPVEDVADLRREGLLGLLVPQALGGMGASFEDYVRVAMTLATGSGSTALVFNMHASVTGALATFPTDVARNLGVPQSFFEVRDKVLHRAVEGAIYGVAITEREAGSRLSALRCSYERAGDGYRIFGHKSVCSGAGHLDAYLVAARSAEAPRETPVISYFFVPAGDGLKVEETWDPLGMRATASNELYLDVTVPADSLIGGVEGLVLPLAYLLPQWLVASYAAVYVGLARAAVDHAITYLKDRVVVGERGALSKLAPIRSRLGRADAAAEYARLVLEEAGRRVDARPGDADTNRWIYRAKLVAGDVAMEVAATVTEACGLGALGRGSPLERIFRDARSGAIMPPSSDVCADYLGTVAFGLDPMTQGGVRPW